jgi:predicted acetyltransferase
MTTHYEREEAISAELRYTEENRRTEPGLPVRDCSLWQAGVDKPVSDLNLVSFRQRFGAISISAEGIGGVETLPGFRRRGYVSKVLERAIAGVATRVPIVFVSDAIEGLYEKFGCVPCLAEGYWSIHLRNLDRLVDLPTPASLGQVRGFSPTDLPAMVDVYNQVHAQRSWTHERHAAWNHLRETRVWQPGSDVIILERDGQLVGYAILNEPQFGHVRESFVVDELAAIDVDAAQVVLAEVGARCSHMRLSEFWVREPRDSAVGLAAQRIGSTYHQTFPRSGGMMGRILDRQRLLRLLEPELRRRLPNADLHVAHTTAFDALCSGAILPDSRDLLRLLVGYWSTTDARAYAVELPAQHEHVLDAWFPGGGTRMLALPYAHTLDRY